MGTASKALPGPAWKRSLFYLQERQKQPPFPRGTGEQEQYLEQTWMLEAAPSPAQHYCTGENRSLRDSTPGLLTVLISRLRGSGSGNKGHTQINPQPPPLLQHAHVAATTSGCSSSSS